MKDNIAVKVEKAYLKYSLPVEEKFMSALDRIFKIQAKRLSQSYIDYKKSGKKDQVTPEEAEKIADQEIEEAFPWEEIFNEAFKSLVQMYLLAGEAGNELCNDLFSPGPRNRIPFSTIREIHLDWINEKGAKQIKRVTETTKKIVRAEMIAGLIDRMSTADIAKLISSRTLELAPGRSRNIARTETHNAIMGVSQENYKAQGFSRQKWFTYGDEVVRAWHVNLNGEEREIGKPFSNGLLYPGDPDGDPKEIVNCRCFAIPTK